MRFLIDTHCFLWTLNAPASLRPSAAELFANEDSTVFFSVVSGLEIAIKAACGKLQLPDAVDAYVSSRIEMLRMIALPVYLTHALQVAELPPIHKDPFDRLLIAQAQIERLPLMTADAAIAAYDVELIWAGRGRAPRRPQR
jgi:PIN domain nuclease of toxin-antitoxin system